MTPGEKRKVGRPPREIPRANLTIRLEAEHLQTLKDEAARRGQSLNRMVEDLLRAAFPPRT